VLILVHVRMNVARHCVLWFLLLITQNLTLRNTFSGHTNKKLGGGGRDFAPSNPAVPPINQCDGVPVAAA
jgi:hypothetical protein